MWKKFLSLTLSAQLIVTPVLAQSGLNDSFSDMNATQLTDAEAAKAKTFKHAGVAKKVVTEGCSKGQCDLDKVAGNGSLLGGEIGAMVEDNLGKLYATIFGGGGALVAAISSVIGINSGAGAMGSAIGAIGTGKEKEEKEGIAILKDKNGNTIKGKENIAKAKTEIKGLDKDNAKKLANGKQIDATVDKEGKATSSSTKVVTDMCSKIAIAVEVGAALNQHLRQKSIENRATTPGNEQKDAIDKAGDLHLLRSQTAMIQAVGFSGIVGCYALMKLFNPAMVLDTKTIIKAGAAAVISAIYYAKSSKHKRAFKTLRELSVKLPIDGACNPYTQTTCFCAEVSSQTLYPAEFQKACLPSLLANRTDLNPLSCVIQNIDGTYKADTACACKAKKTCVNTNLSMLGLNFNGAANLMNQSQGAIDASLAGNFQEGQLNSAFLKTAALNNRVLASLDKKVPSTKLDAKSQILANELAKILPPNIAASIAATPGNDLPEGYNKIAAPEIKAPEAAQKAVDEATKKAAYENAGSGFESTSTQEEITLPGVAGMEEKGNTGSEIVSFTEEAVRNTGVSKQAETPIFDIISYRYRQSAWNKVDVKVEASAGAEAQPATPPSR